MFVGLLVIARRTKELDVCDVVRPSERQRNDMVGMALPADRFSAPRMRAEMILSLGQNFDLLGRVRSAATAYTRSPSSTFCAAGFWIFFGPLCLVCSRFDRMVSLPSGAAVRGRIRGIAFLVSLMLALWIGEILRVGTFSGALHAVAVFDVSKIDVAGAAARFSGEIVFQSKRLSLTPSDYLW